MSNVARVAGQAANTLSKPLNVEDVFSTYLYTGTGSAQTITNGVDLAGEGGLVWHKARESATNNDHSLFDSETSTGATFPSIQKAWESNVAGSLAARTAWTFNSDGFTTTASDGSNGTDQNGIDYVTWSFRKCSKFFDVVNYTGNSTSGRTISHNLGVVPAMIIVLGQSTGDYWIYHKDVGNTKYLELNKTTAAQTSSGAWNNTTPTDSVFTVGTGLTVNNSGSQYTAYLFAHNDGDGEFGPDGDADIIKCGSYTGSGAGSLPNFIDLGFEPQWVMIKNTTDSNTSWAMFDSMRALNLTGTARLLANSSGAEYSSSTYNSIAPTPTGFNLTNGESWYNASGKTYIYIAIRRGPMAVPESATDVFETLSYTGSGSARTLSTSITADLLLTTRTTSDAKYTLDRMRGGSKYLSTNSTSAEGTQTIGLGDIGNDFLEILAGGGTINANTKPYYTHLWKRAPNYFDVVAYTGDGTGTRTLSHNLEATPEMIWLKKRSITSSWYVYHKDLSDPNNGYLSLEDNSARSASSGIWGTGPTSTNFQAILNTSSQTHIAYLFASLDGVSKVGSYTGNGTNQNIDCGFSSGARFVLIKPITSGNSWYVWNSTSGIVAGNDPFLLLDTTDAEITGADYIDPYSGGFNVTGGAGTVNASGVGHIFYAIA